jgi:hypothetical protein
MSQSSIDPVAIATKYLASSGHALEHATAKVLTDRGWTPTMALQVPGADGTPRDCDVLAHRCFTAGGKEGGLKCSAVVLIECKHVPDDRVWILMGSNMVHEPATIPSYIPHMAPDGAVLNAVPQRTARSVEAKGVRELSIGIVEARKGDVKRNDRDPAYAAVEKAVDLSWSVVKRWDMTTRSGLFTVAQFVVPIVVVRGNLVRAVFSPERMMLVPQVVERGRLIHAVPPQSTRVEVTTDHGLASLLSEIESDAQLWSRSVLTWVINKNNPKARHPWKPLVKLARDRVPLEERRARRAARKTAAMASTKT